jgi:hypothetical protein
MVLMGRRRTSNNITAPAPWPAARLKVVTLLVANSGENGLGQTVFPGGIRGVFVGVLVIVGVKVMVGVFVTVAVLVMVKVGVNVGVLEGV